MSRDEGLRVLVVGAGPAGSRAAETLVKHGVRPIVIDEAPRNGGQIYRQQPEGFTRPARTLYGLEAKKATHLHDGFAALAGRVDYRPETLVWNLWSGIAYTMGPGGPEEVPYDALLLATGAMDRAMPLPGWTLPGVYSMGGAQVALKYQACAIGRRVAFCGTGPLLYLVAYQYKHAGAEVVAVLDTSRLAAGAARRSARDHTEVSTRTLTCDGAPSCSRTSDPIRACRTGPGRAAACAARRTRPAPR